MLVFIVLELIVCLVFIEILYIGKLTCNILDRYDIVVPNILYTSVKLIASVGLALALCFVYKLTQIDLQRESMLKNLDNTNKNIEVVDIIDMNKRIDRRNKLLPWFPKLDKIKIDK